MFILKIQRPWKSNVTLFTLFSYNFGVLSEKKNIARFGEREHFFCIHIL